MWLIRTLMGVFIRVLRIQTSKLKF